jgi:hypothetical protein
MATFGHEKSSCPFLHHCKFANPLRANVLRLAPLDCTEFQKFQNYPQRRSTAPESRADFAEWKQSHNDRTSRTT